MKPIQHLRDKSRRGRNAFREDGLVLKINRPSNSKTIPGHFRIVISKKVAPLAVKRNRIRRVLREASRRELDSFLKSYDMIFVVLPGFELGTMEGMRKIVGSLLSKASSTL